MFFRFHTFLVNFPYFVQRVRLCVGLHLVGLFDLIYFSCIPIVLVRSNFVDVIVFLSAFVDRLVAPVSYNCGTHGLVCFFLHKVKKYYCIIEVLNEFMHVLDIHEIPCIVVFGSSVLLDVVTPLATFALPFLVFLGLFLFCL